MATERRRAPRFQVSQLIELGFGRESQVAASGLNISSGGLLCRTEPYVEPGTRVFLSIHLPTDDIVNCEGIVLRSEKTSEGYFEAAISFTEFQGDAAAALVRYLGGQESGTAPRHHSKPSHGG